MRSLLNRRPGALSIATGAAAILAGVFAAGAAPPKPAATFEGQVRPLLARHCFGCHSAGNKQGQLDLTAFKTEASLRANREVWRDVFHQLRAHTMPPEKAAQPSEAERKLLVEWLDGKLAQWDAQAPPDPGPLPIHRLNRAEYNHTVRDLIGLDLRPADDFPVDDTAHGFDNVADVLTLSPILLEKYLAAAERILDRALVPDGKLPWLEQKLQGEDLAGVDAAGEVADLPLEREIGTTLEAPAPGEYQVRVRAWQTGSPDEPATLVLKVDGVDSHVWSLPQEKQPVELTASIPLGPGKRRVSVRHTWHTALSNGQRPPEVRMSVDWLEISGPARTAAHRRLLPVEPGPAVTERAAAEQALRRFATRAFRRPAEAAELSRLLALYDRGRKAGKPHLEAVRLPLLSVLVSPQFLFRIERGAAERDAHGSARLDDWELASRLSYFLWSSMPDEELFRLAAERRLRDPQVLRAQVTRMLADPKSRALAENFGGQWLGTRKLETSAPDPQMFPAFRAGLRRAVAEEPLLFFQAVQREDRSVLEFLNADWTYANEDLARLYGLRGVTGGRMRRVSLAGTPRGGVMTMAAVLTVTSHPTRTSAVKRGKWVLEELLGAPPPPPPPSVPELEVPAKGQAPAATLRERLERHRSDPRCSGCHVRMDVLGLGLENFDAIGRWREKEGPHRIDPAGTLPGGETFTGPAELKKVLSRQPEEFTRTLSEKMFVYALGRGIQPSDRREIQRIATETARAGYRFSALVTGIVESYPFRYRRARPQAPQKVR